MNAPSMLWMNAGALTFTRLNISIAWYYQIGKPFTVYGVKDLRLFIKRNSLNISDAVDENSAPERSVIEMLEGRV